MIRNFKNTKNPHSQGRLRRCADFIKLDYLNLILEVLKCGLNDVLEFKGGEGWRLVRARRESGAGWFLYENNYSIHQQIKDAISRELSVIPIMINSALVSAQTRKRCYWTNIPGVTQPMDKGIMLADIIDNAVAWTGKSYCLTANYDGATLRNTLERRQRTMVAESVHI